MIGFLTGTIQELLGEDRIILLTQGGVGYEVRIGRAQELKKVQTLSILTYLKVTDQSLELFGFRTLEERSFFELLLSVTGIGPKSAMTILSLGTLSEIQEAVARGDVNYLSSVSGIGKKTAERMVLELRSKVADGLAPHESSRSSGIQMGEVIEALVGMGYDRGEARRVVQEIAVEEKTTEELLRETLRRLGQ